MTEDKIQPEKNPSDTAEKNARQIMADRKAAKNSAPKPQPDTPSSDFSKKSNGTNWSLRLLLILVVFLLGSGTGIYFLPFLQDRLPIITKWTENAPQELLDNSVLRERLATFEQRLEGTEQELQALKTTDQSLDQRLNDLPQIAPTEPDPMVKERLDRLEQNQLTAEGGEHDTSQSARIDMLLGRMSQLESSFVPLSKGLSDAQDARLERKQLAEKSNSALQVLDQIESRLSRVEQFTARDNSGVLLAFRIGELRRKMMSGQDYSTEITAVKSLTEQGAFALDSGLNDAVSWLSQHKQGIIPSERLRDDFFDLIPALIRTETHQTDDPWWKRAYSNTRNLIMIRKTSPDQRDDLDNMIARTQRMLERLDLAGALAVMKDMPEKMHPILNDWMRRAEIYLRAHEELNRIESLSVAHYLVPTQDKQDQNEGGSR